MYATSFLQLAAAQNFVLGGYGPLGSIDLKFAGFFVLADLDYQKNFDPTIKARFGDPIVEVPNLQSGVNINLKIGDSNSEPSVGMQQVLKFVQNHNIAGLIGGYHSAITMPINTVMGALSTPQVSWGSTSPALSNKAVYPFFKRTIPPDSLQALAIAQWLIDFNVEAVGYVFATEAYGEGLRDATKDVLSRTPEGRAVTAVSIPWQYAPGGFFAEDGTVSNPEAKAKADQTCQMIKDARMKVLVIAMTQDQAKYLLRTCEPFGIHSPEYQMLGSEASHGLLNDAAFFNKHWPSHGRSRFNGYPWAVTESTTIEHSKTCVTPKGLLGVRLVTQVLGCPK